MKQSKEQLAALAPGAVANTEENPAQASDDPETGGN
jgi:hypothetical protein